MMRRKAGKANANRSIPLVLARCSSSFYGRLACCVVNDDLSELCRAIADTLASTFIPVHALGIHIHQLNDIACIHSFSPDSILLMHNNMRMIIIKSTIHYSKTTTTPHGSRTLSRYSCCTSPRHRSVLRPWRFLTPSPQHHLTSPALFSIH